MIHHQPGIDRFIDNSMVATEELETYEGFTKVQWEQIHQVMDAMPEAVDDHIRRNANGVTLHPWQFDKREVAAGIIARLKQARGEQ